MNNMFEMQYKELLFNILANGETQREEGRNGFTIRSFGQSIEFKNTCGLFPMLTSKKMYFKNVNHELKWLLSGETDVKYLTKNKVRIWEPWVNQNGTIGDTYGKVLRNFNGIDQLTESIEILRKNRSSRQNVISLWNPSLIKAGNIKPCYHAIQFVCINGVLNVVVSQRSSDVFIGLPYDICVFDLLLLLVAKILNFIPGTLKINIGDAHIYEEHIEPCKVYLANKKHDLPSIYIDVNGIKNVQDFKTENVFLRNYISEEFIYGEIKL